METFLNLRSGKRHERKLLNSTENDVVSFLVEPERELSYTICRIDVAGETKSSKIYSHCAENITRWSRNMSKHMKKKAHYTC